MGESPTSLAKSSSSCLHKTLKKKKERPTGHAEDVTVSVYGGKRGAGANGAGTRHVASNEPA